MRRVAVIGLGTLGANLAMALVRHGVEVLAIDKDEQYVEEIQDQVTSVAIIDTTKEKNLWKINIFGSRPRQARTYAHRTCHLTSIGSIFSLSGNFISRIF